MFWKLFPGIFLLILTVSSVQGQSPVGGKSDPMGSAPRSGSSRNRDDQEGPSVPGDMRIRMAIERDEMAHNKLLEYANQLGELSESVAKRFSETHVLTTDEYKNLGSIEKLARKILTSTGGEVVKADPAQPPVTDAIDQLKTVACGVRKQIIAESRFEVSASVIADSNQIIQLVEQIRRTNK